MKQYLDAEVEFVISSVRDADSVLELGCGYGRALRAVSPFVSKVVGNDISRESLELAKTYMKPYANFELVETDASNMAFCPCVFNAVICIQNGISVFGVDKRRLVAESIRVTKNGGLILFSSYSPKIWEDRLEWFKRQSQIGLLGKIDEEKTHDGTIVCKDGFRATTVSDYEFVELFDEFGLNASVTEVDESSIFCGVIKNENLAGASRRSL